MVPKEGEEVDQRPEIDQEDYNEEEDEDFDPNKIQEGSDEEDEDEDFKGENNRSKPSTDYSRIESDTGGLVRTRRARQEEEERQKRHKYETLQVESVSESSANLWEELKHQGLQRLKGAECKKSVLDTTQDADNMNNSSSERQILIKRNYKFAGELVHEEKMVPVSSAEAREYLNSIKFQKSQDDTNKKFLSSGVEEQNEHRTNLRRPLKRPPLLEQIVSGALKPKLTTLEKSSLDWASYVDKEGINEELTLHNKDGYLAKQDFLSRVESFKDQQYKDLRQKQLSMQLQNGT
ncbi:hypothetical protein ZYGR_0I06160 [Zygosaccharomyces rouxii]|uniref:SWR1-complex protein 5 n=2 Tax=Zygosaccharomyces rouxii TaxID=4956 RepID=C5DU81_ZYGRC|nr:uncharacterized protein ZYRO0C14652g [Zygosaccharomyces rouxii]KAH9201484.1 bucentaur or craniofacial development-domain-containing protein [Zygosaccharomyces rouxii]GAV48319.1 hypothetical protein ZYGR_0I06160 [Zygosaccharomyces rouxii]CAR27342.1 ZYRO0C14652p [Zygosaccharomyces rouxii]